MVSLRLVGNLITATFLFFSNSYLSPFAGIGDTQLDVLGFGDVKVEIKLNDDDTTIRTLKDVLFVPSLGINLFSISAATAKGIEAHFHEEKVSRIESLFFPSLTDSLSNYSCVYR